MRVLPIIAAITVFISVVTGLEALSVLLCVSSVALAAYLVNNPIRIMAGRSVVRSRYEWLCLLDRDAQAGHELLPKMRRMKDTWLSLEVLMEADLRQLEKEGLILSEPIRSKSHPMRARNREYKLTRKGYAEQKNHSIHLLQPY